MSNIKSLNENVYLLVVKAMARVGWWMQRPLIRIQQEAMRHPINVSDEEVEEYLAANRERHGSDTLSNRSRPRDYWGCSDECGPGHTRNKGCQLYEQALKEAHDNTFGTRTLDVSTEDIKSWPKVEWRTEAQLEVERIRQADLEQDEALVIPGLRDFMDEYAPPALPVEQTVNTHGLRMLERITEPSHSKEWGPLERFIAHCHCGWKSEQCYPQAVAYSQQYAHNAAHSANVADFGIGQTSD